ncbi:MAG: SDR family NAD(P)-dependent oxidoreductase [Actinomycetota bacterium]|nr:SDR family NAD(P)-dependent oxidoreductase [Actinomycetota bacterium]
MKVLVTGGAGFIGSHIVDALIEAGAQVRVVDNLHPSTHHEAPQYLNEKAEFFRIDLADENAAAQVVGGMDAVCHQASMVGLGQSFNDVTDYVKNNDVGTACLLRAMYGTGFTGRLVLASSIVVYGQGLWRCREHELVRPAPRARADLERGIFDPRCPKCGGALEPQRITEAMPADPVNVYAATKLHQEHLCFVYGGETGVPVAALRYHNVYGPRMPRDTPYAGVTSIFRSRLEAGMPPRVFEDGNQQRDFIHVRDVAHANLRCLLGDRGPAGAFNIATGEAHSVGEMAAALAAAFGPDAPRPQVTGDFRTGDVRHVVASPKRANRDLDWHARVSFDVGMKEFSTSSLR